jgi:hypothetical protein
MVPSGFLSQVPTMLVGQQTCESVGVDRADGLRSAALAAAALCGAEPRPARPGRAGARCGGARHSVCDCLGCGRLDSGMRRDRSSAQRACKGGAGNVPAARALVLTPAVSGGREGPRAAGAGKQALLANKRK